MKYLNIIALTAVLTVFTACGTTKKTTDFIVVEDFPPSRTSVAPAEVIAKNTGTWNTMQCGGSITLGGKRNFTSSVNVRMEHDKSICISLRPLLGIEVGRLVFKGDSVIIIDKVHRQYIAENVSVLTNGLPATVSTLQDIFLGRAFILGEGSFNSKMIDKASCTNVDGKMTLKPNKQLKGFAYEFTFDEKNRILALNVVPEGAKATTYTVNYNDVQATIAGNIAHAVSIAGTIKGNELNLGLNLNNITWNQAVKIDASIPSNYKRADISNINSLLSGE